MLFSLHCFYVLVPILFYSGSIVRKQPLDMGILNVYQNPLFYSLILMELKYVIQILLRFVTDIFLFFNVLQVVGKLIDTHENMIV